MGLLLGRLGVETARVPHTTRHGLIWLERGNLFVENGCLSFRTPGFFDIPGGCYGIPHQGVSAIVMGPGTTISHDALRILASHGTAVMAVGSGGIRIYTAPPLRPDLSIVARRQARVWADEESRSMIARRMFGWRFGEVFPHQDLNVLRGMEGARVKRMYATLAQRHGIKWRGRNYDRSDPAASDSPNEAINHSSTAMYAAAAIAVYSVGAIPQLGFIHEHSGDAFCLDIADLYRMEVTVPVAFDAVKAAEMIPDLTLDRHVRKLMARALSRQSLIDDMIRRIKELFDVDDGGGDA